MALMHLESFDHYSSTAQLLRKGWAGMSSAALNTTGGRRSGGCLQLATNNACRPIHIFMTGTKSTVIMGFAYYESAPAADAIMTLSTSVTTSVAISWGLDGYFKVHRSTTGWAPTEGVYAPSCPILGQGSSSLSRGMWVYIEWKVVAHASAGSSILNVNGQELVNVTNVNTTGTDGGVNLASFTLTGGQGSSRYYDDMYRLDGSGGVNDAFWGDTRVDAHYPNGAGSKAEWTPSAGSNYQNVDDGSSGPDDDTTRNTTLTVGQIDTFALENLKNAGGTIKGIQVSNCHSKDNAGVCVTRNVIRIGSTEYEGANQYPSAGSYVYAVDRYDQSPATNAAWDETEFNGMEAGYKRQS